MIPQALLVVATTEMFRALSQTAIDRGKTVCCPISIVTEHKCLRKLPHQLFAPGERELFPGQTCISRAIGSPEAERIENTGFSRVTGNVKQHGSSHLPYFLPGFSPPFPIERWFGKGSVRHWERRGSCGDDDGVRISRIDSDT